MSCGVIVVGELLTLKCVNMKTIKWFQTFILLYFSVLPSLSSWLVSESDYGLYILLVIIGTGADAPGSYEV